MFDLLDSFSYQPSSFPGHWLDVREKSQEDLNREQERGQRVTKAVKGTRLKVMDEGKWFFGVVTRNIGSQAFIQKDGDTESYPCPGDFQDIKVSKKSQINFCNHTHAQFFAAQVSQFLKFFGNDFVDIVNKFLTEEERRVYEAKRAAEVSNLQSPARLTCIILGILHSCKVFVFGSVFNSSAKNQDKLHKKIQGWTLSNCTVIVLNLLKKCMAKLMLKHISQCGI